MATIKQLEDSLVQLITAAIGWNAEDERVRIAWQGESAPFIPSAWDCCFIRVTPVSDMTAGYRDAAYTDGAQYTAAMTAKICKSPVKTGASVSKSGPM